MNFHSHLFGLRRWLETPLTDIGIPRLLCLGNCWSSRPGRAQRIFRRLRICHRQGPQQPARRASGRRKSPRGFRQARSCASRRLSFSDPTRRHASQPRARLDRRTISGSKCLQPLFALARHSFARGRHVDLDHARFRRNYFSPHRLRRAGAEVHRDRQSPSGLRSRWCGRWAHFTSCSNPPSGF